MSDQIVPAAPAATAAQKAADGSAKLPIVVKQAKRGARAAKAEPIAATATAGAAEAAPAAAKSVAAKVKQKIAPVAAKAVAASIEAAAAVIAPPAPVTDTKEAVTSPARSVATTISDVIQAAAEAAPTPIKEGKIMATVTTENTQFTTEKLQSMFGDVGARFKAGFEKSTKLSEEMVDLAKGNVEAVVASARVAAKGSEALGQDAADYTKKSFESAVAAMKSFASIKSPTELFQLQSDFAKASFDSAVAEASRFSESMMKLAGDVAQPLSTRYAVAADKIKSAAL